MKKNRCFSAGNPAKLEGMALTLEMALEFYTKKMLWSYTNVSNTSSMPVSTKRLQIKPWTLQKRRGPHWSYVVLANFQTLWKLLRGKKSFAEFDNIFAFAVWASFLSRGAVWCGAAAVWPLSSRVELQTLGLPETHEGGTGLPSLGV